jgi:hypothetical protein
MAEKTYTDAIMLLRADHEEVKSLFGQFEQAEGSERKRSIAEQICNELKIHSMIEEEFFYPALRGEIEDDMLDEAVVEHDGAKVLINDIMEGGPDEDFYEAKVTVLQEQIEHHVEEEEEPGKGIFAQARKTDVDLKALLEPMLARKQELKQQAETAGLPPAQLSAVEA